MEGKDLKILSVECSASPASAAIIEDGKVLGSYFVNVKTTHSQTLMPMIASLLKSTSVDIGEIEGIAVAQGPGSFTGIRIGISAVKGLAVAKNIKCVGVSTLGAMAENFRDRNAVICAVMDARCNQVYNALFKIKNGEISRLCEDRAVMCEELKTELENSNFADAEIIVTGDGADLFYGYVKDLKNVKLADEAVKYQNARGVAFAAEKLFNEGKTVSGEELLPVYLRLPQAERELKAKKEKEGKNQ